MTAGLPALAEAVAPTVTAPFCDVPLAVTVRVTKESDPAMNETVQVAEAPPARDVGHPVTLG